MVQRHWQDVTSSAHFLPLQGRQSALGDGVGEVERGGEGGAEGKAATLVGGGDGIGGEDGGGRVGEACVLDERRV